MGDSDEISLADRRKYYKDSLQECDPDHGRYSLLTADFTSEEYVIGDYTKTRALYSLMANKRRYCRASFECIPYVNYCVPCPAGKYCPVGTVRYQNAVLSNLCPKGSYCELPYEEEPCPPGYACGIASSLLNTTLTPHCSSYEDSFAVYCPGSSSLGARFVFENVCEAGSFCPPNSNGTKMVKCPDGHYCYEGVKQPEKCEAGLLFNTAELGFAPACSKQQAYPGYDGLQIIQFFLLLVAMWAVYFSINLCRLVHRFFYKQKLRQEYVKKSKRAFRKYMESGELTSTKSTKKLKKVLQKQGLLDSVKAKTSKSMFAMAPKQTKGRLAKSELEHFLVQQIVEDKKNEMDHSVQMAEISNSDKFRNNRSSWISREDATEDDQDIMFTERSLKIKGHWKQQMDQVWEKYDSNNKGYLEEDEFQALYREFNILVDHDAHVAEVKGFTEKEIRYNIRFSNLGLKLKSNHKTVLRDVNGEFRESQLIAVMGPSGSGKSTFLNTLCGRAYYGDRSGNIYVNNKKDSVMHHREAVGFVPQEDTVFETLTVYENFLYAANLKLMSASREKRELIVEDIIRLLELEHIRDSVVGSAESRGISGGQRKRVNIGIELCGDPTLLFLDEPTSGLDSASATVVITALKELAKLGMTVVAVIHQPRYSVFSLFDQLLLLGKGGETVYCGPTLYVGDYFGAVGFSCKEKNVNLADFIIDCCAGIIPREGYISFVPADLPGLWEEFGAPFQEELKNRRASDVDFHNIAMNHQLLPTDLSVFLDHLRSYMIIMSSKKLSINDLKKIYALIEGERAIPTNRMYLLKKFTYSLASSSRLPPDEREHTFEAIQKRLVAYTTDKNSILQDINKEKRRNREKNRRKLMDKVKERSPPRQRSLRKVQSFRIAVEQPFKRLHLATCWKQYMILQHRSYQILVHKKMKSHVIDIFVLVLCGVICGAMLQSRDPYLNFKMLPIALTLSVTVLCTLIGIGATNAFGATKLLYYRERGSGLYVFPYFISRMFIDILVSSVKCFAFGTVYFDMAAPTISRMELVTLFICSAYVTSSLGHISSILFDGKQLMVMVTAGFCFVLGGLMTGLSPNLKTIEEAQFPVPQLYSLSYGRWSVEALLAKWVSLAPFPYKSMATKYLENEGYKVHAARFDANIAALIFIGTFLRVLTFVLLLTVNREKQGHDPLLELHFSNRCCSKKGKDARRNLILEFREKVQRRNTSLSFKKLMKENFGMKKAHRYRGSIRDVLEDFEVDEEGIIGMVLPKMTNNPMMMEMTTRSKKQQQ